MSDIFVPRYELKPLHNAYEVANWFLAWTYGDDLQITKLSLQKLLYLSQGYSLAKHGRRMFPERILAYEHGPVVFELLDIDSEEDNEVVLKDDFDFNSFTNEENELLASIWERYKDYAPARFRNHTHRHSIYNKTWEETPKGEILPEEIETLFLAEIYAPAFR